MDQMITVDDVRTICINKATFDTSKFMPFIEPAEQTFIRPFLGESLYNEIRAQYKANTLTADNETLRDSYLKTALAWFVLHKALPFMNIEITDSGLQRNNSEFASAGTTEERGALVKEALDIANIYLEKAKYFLEEVASDGTYPLYFKGDNVTNNTGIIGGILFDIEEEEEGHNE